MVAGPGIEPGTQGFSVLCSTNWATQPYEDLFIKHIDAHVENILYLSYFIFEAEIDFQSWIDFY